MQKKGTLRIRQELACVGFCFVIGLGVRLAREMEFHRRMFAFDPGSLYFLTDAGKTPQHFYGIGFQQFNRYSSNKLEMDTELESSMSNSGDSDDFVESVDDSFTLELANEKGNVETFVSGMPLTVATHVEYAAKLNSDSASSLVAISSNKEATQTTTKVQEQIVSSSVGKGSADPELRIPVRSSFPFPSNLVGKVTTPRNAEEPSSTMLESVKVDSQTLALLTQHHETIVRKLNTTLNHTESGGDTPLPTRSQGKATTGKAPEGTSDTASTISS